MGPEWRATETVSTVLQVLKFTVTLAVGPASSSLSDPCPKNSAGERTVQWLVHCAFCNPPRFQTLSLASRWSRCRTAKVNDFRAPLLAAGQNGKRKKKKSQKSGLRPVASVIARDHTRARKEPRSLITMGGGNVCPPAGPLAVPPVPPVPALPSLSPPSSRLSGNRNAQIADLGSPSDRLLTAYDREPRQRRSVPGTTRKPGRRPSPS